MVDHLKGFAIWGIREAQIAGIYEYAIVEPTKLSDTKTKPVAKNAPPPASSKSAPIVATTKALKTAKGGWTKRPAAVLDFILRLCAIAATLADATVMGITDQTLPFFTQFLRFQVSSDDLPALV